MGLFGKNEDKQRDNDALAAEVMRLDALPYEQLAEDVLTRGFGPGGPDAEKTAGIYEVVMRFKPDRIFGLDATLESQIADLVEEGVHLLYRAGLVKWNFSGGDTASMSWELTRAGRRALAQGTVAASLQGFAPRVP